jgi:hypothetical protein
MPSIQETTLSKAISALLSRASLVAKATWGVKTAFFAFSSGWSGEIGGSVSNTRL